MLCILIFQHLKKKQWTNELKMVSPNEATEGDLRLVHSASYLRSLKVCIKGRSELPPVFKICD